MRSPLAYWWGAFWRLPQNRRWQLLQQLLPLLRYELSISTAESCIFQNLENYAAEYSRLATSLGQPRKSPPPGEIEFLREIAQRPTRYYGAIGMSEVLFLTAFAGIIAPPRVVEIGTLTGFSAVILAAALCHQHGRTGAAIVDTIDYNQQCIIDETRATGFEIPILAPDLAPMIRLHTPRDATFVAALAQPNELSMIFIDADHRHPFVLLDVLRVTPYVRDEGWIVLHDIQLGTMGEKMRERGEPTPWGAPYGAQWLFERWPFRKISGGNIGALQVPHDRSLLVPFALRLMSVPFELEERHVEKACRNLYQSFAELL